MSPKSPPHSAFRASALGPVHSVTIAISAVGAFVFAVWSVRRGYVGGDAPSLAIGAFAFCVAAALSVYLVRFTKKLGASRTTRPTLEPELGSEDRSERT